MRKRQFSSWPLLASLLLLNALGAAEALPTADRSATGRGKQRHEPKAHPYPAWQQRKDNAPKSQPPVWQQRKDHAPKSHPPAAAAAGEGPGSWEPPRQHCTRRRCCCPGFIRLRMIHHHNTICRGSNSASCPPFPLRTLIMPPLGRNSPCACPAAVKGARQGLSMRISQHQGRPAVATNWRSAKAEAVSLLPGPSPSPPPCFPVPAGASPIARAHTHTVTHTVTHTPISTAQHQPHTLAPLNTPSPLLTKHRRRKRHHGRSA